LFQATALSRQSRNRIDGSLTRCPLKKNNIGEQVKLLFVKLGAIGDVAQAAVALSEYRRRSPDLHLTWVVGHRVRSLAESFNVADRVISLNDDGLYSGSRITQVSTLVRCAVSLASSAKYDRIVTAYADWRYGLLTACMRSGSRERFRSLSHRPSPLQQRSRVHEYWRLLSGMDSEAIDIAAATRGLGDQISGLPEVDVKYNLPRDFIVIAPGGAKNPLRDDALRRWPIDRYRQLIQNLMAAGHAIVLMGGTTDRWAADALSDLGSIDLVGKTDLLDVLAILLRSSALVGNDSGILHLGALTDTAIVGLFGPTPVNAFVPLGRPGTIALAVGNKVSCSPCYDGRNYANCARNICMEAIPTTLVVESVEAALEATRRGPVLS
jgi:heptosyltransferase II